MKVENEKTKYNMWLLVEGVLLQFAIAVLCFLNMNRLGVVEIINIAFDWMGMGILIPCR